MKSFAVFVFAVVAIAFISAQSSENDASGSLGPTGGLTTSSTGQLLKQGQQGLQVVFTQFQQLFRPIIETFQRLWIIVLATLYTYTNE